MKKDMLEEAQWHAADLVTALGRLVKENPDFTDLWQRMWELEQELVAEIDARPRVTVVRVVGS